MTSPRRAMAQKLLKLAGFYPEPPDDDWLNVADYVLGLTSEIERLRAMLRSGMCMVHGLGCPGCGAQGRQMATPGKCCRDVDCDAGFYGIGCDEVKDFLEAADELMPGTLVEIEHPGEPVNLARET